MEPDAREFLVRITKSISMVILWMLVNMTFGVFFGFAFIESSIAIGNVIFYIFLLGSLSALIWYLLKVWKQPAQA